MRRWHKTQDILKDLKDIKAVATEPVYTRIVEHIENLEKEVESLKKVLENKN